MTKQIPDRQPQAVVLATATVRLAGRTYEVKPLRRKANKAWRLKFQEPFELLFGLLQNFQGIELTVENVVGIINTVRSNLLNSPDLLADMLFDYSPELATDRAWIEENCYDEEILRALLEVLKLVYPFGAIKSVFGPMTGLIGQDGTVTSPS